MVSSTQHSLRRSPRTESEGLSHSPQPIGDACISIIGAGFSGTVSAIQAINEYKAIAARGPVPPLTIHWFDPSNNLQRGAAYQRQDNPEDGAVLTLNQPASRMSPFPDEPEHFANWLEKRGRGGSSTFAPRSLYGDYLDELLIRSMVGTPDTLRVLKHGEKVQRILQTEDEGVIVKTSSQAIESHSGVVAIGHHFKDPFSDLSSTPGYLKDLWQISGYKELILRNNSAQSVLLIGGGPSTLDAIAALEHAGFRGKYIIVSAAVSQPWSFDPELYSDANFGRYKRQKLLTLTPQWIEKNANYRDLCRALLRDKRKAIRAGFGEGHVYYSVDLDALEHIAKDQSSPVKQEHLIRFGKMLAQLRSCLASPKGHDLYKRLQSEGRFQWVKGRADPESTNFDYGSESYTTCVSHRNKSTWVGGDLFINCAQLGAGKGPLDSLLFGSPRHLFLVGPPSTASRLIAKQHGVESFRDHIKRCAKDAVQIALRKVSAPES